MPTSSRGSCSKFSPTSELTQTHSTQTSVEKMSVEYRNKVHSFASVSICDLIESTVTHHIFCIFFFLKSNWEKEMIHSSVCKSLLWVSAPRYLLIWVSQVYSWVKFAAEKNQVSLNVLTYMCCTSELENAVMSSCRAQQTERTKTTWRESWHFYLTSGGGSPTGNAKRHRRPLDLFSPPPSLAVCLNPPLWDGWTSPQPVQSSNQTRPVSFALVSLSFTSSDQRVLFGSHQFSSGPGGTHLGGATGWKTQWPSHIWLIYCCFYFSQWNLASCFYFCGKWQWSWRGMAAVSPPAVLLSEGHRDFILSSRSARGLKHLKDASDTSSCGSIVEGAAKESRWWYL